MAKGYTTNGQAGGEGFQNIRWPRLYGVTVLVIHATGELEATWHKHTSTPLTGGTMLRIRSLGVTCAREVVRSGTAARGGGTTAAVVCHAVRTLSDSSQVLVAPQPPPSSVSGHDGHLHSETAPTGEEGIQYDHQLDRRAVRRICIFRCLWLAIAAMLPAE